MIGELKQSVIDNFKLPDYCAAASVDVQSISEAIAAQDTNYQELSKYPSVTQDITLRSQEYSYQQLMDKLENAVEDELSTSQRAQFELLGVYQADGSDGKRMSWRVSVVDRDSTLEANQVNQLLDKAAATIESAERV
jgi:phenylalanyl-tRNA synthetase beta subunit